MKKIVILTVLFLFAATLAAHGADNPVLARIGKKKITLSDFNRMFSLNTFADQQRLNQQPQAKELLLRRIVIGMVIADLAREKGFDKRPEIKEKKRIMINDFLTTEYLEKVVAAKAKVSDKEVRKYYDEHQDEFKTPETARARHLLVKIDPKATKEQKAKARKKAVKLRKQILKGEDFAVLAQKHSDDPGSAAKGGDLGFFAKGRMVPPFDKAVFALKPGKVSDIVETRFGYHIIKVEEKKAGGVAPFKTVQAGLSAKLNRPGMQKEIKSFIDKLLKEKGVEINAEPLSKK